MHQFFHCLKINNIIKTNIASKLPYPKIKKKEPQFLSFNQLKEILNYFMPFATLETGLRNLITILFLVVPGLRISSIIDINIQDIDIKTHPVCHDSTFNVRQLTVTLIYGRCIPEIFTNSRGQETSLYTITGLSAASYQSIYQSRPLAIWVSPLLRNNFSFLDLKQFFSASWS